MTRREAAERFYNVWIARLHESNIAIAAIDAFAREREIEALEEAANTGQKRVAMLQRKMKDWEDGSEDYFAYNLAATEVGRFVNEIDEAIAARRTP
jgi:uncharacterized protein YbaP (TraB family)